MVASFDLINMVILAAGFLAGIIAVLWLMNAFLWWKDKHSWHENLQWVILTILTIIAEYCLIRFIMIW